MKPNGPASSTARQVAWCSLELSSCRLALSCFVPFSDFLLNPWESKTASREVRVSLFRITGDLKSPPVNWSPHHLARCGNAKETLKAAGFHHHHHPAKMEHGGFRRAERASIKRGQSWIVNKSGFECCHLVSVFAKGRESPKHGYPLLFKNPGYPNLFALNWWLLRGAHQIPCSRGSTALHFSM